MQIFQSEINDGLQVAMANQAIAIECPLFSQEFDDKELVSIASLLNEEERQPDLYYLNSVLVSAGWNKNDDVFNVQALWDARHTPVNKQFNFMHDETDIIGHMTKSMVLDHEGNVINDDTSEDALPSQIDIITSAVIYKTWSDAEMRDRIHNIISEIDDGKWSVSMECIFQDFDYAIITPDGEEKVLARSEESAFLTKHLRAYGGKGEYEGYKLGRLLKSLYFSGKGLVNKPANPRSIIFNKSTNPFNSQANITISNFLTAMEADDMSEAQKQVDELTEALDSTKAELESVKADLTQEKNDLQAQMNEAIAEKDGVIASLETKVKELEDAIAKMHEDKKKMEEENEDMKKKMKNMKRKAALIEAGADETSANELLAKFDNADDEMFKTVVALVENKPATEPAPVEPPSQDDETEADVDADELDAVEDVDESIAIEEEDLPNEVEASIAKASEYFRNSVLKTTKKA